MRNGSYQSMSISFTQPKDIHNFNLQYSRYNDLTQRILHGQHVVITLYLWVTNVKNKTWIL